MLIRTFAGLVAVALTLAVAACGSDDEEPADRAATAPAATAQTDAGTGTTAAPETTTGAATETAEDEAASPEDQEGGAGDEEAARTEVELAFSRDGFSPREARVAPYIPVVVIVRSDGTAYDLRYRAPGARGSITGSGEAKLELDGMRPGEEAELSERNTGARARIVAADAAGP